MSTSTHRRYLVHPTAEMCVGGGFKVGTIVLGQGSAGLVQIGI